MKLNRKEAKKASQTDEIELLQKIAQGDRAAFEALYFQHYHALYQFIGRVTRRSDLCEDILNESMLTVWQKADNFRGDSKVSTWIFGIAYNKALKSLEKSARWNSRFSSLDEQTLDSKATPLAKPDENLTEIQLQQHVHQGLQKLNPEQRTAFELTFYFGYSYPEIAKVCNCSVNTIKTRMFHARRSLQQHVNIK